MSLLPNSVINGDCLEVMKEIDTASIDMILCDLPYGATQNKWDSVISPPPTLGAVRKNHQAKWRNPFVRPRQIHSNHDAIQSEVTSLQHHLGQGSKKRFSQCQENAAA